MQQLGGLQGFNATRKWKPTNDTTLWSWWDFGDDAQNTIVSSAYSQCNDKSGNARHLTQGTSGKRPSQTTAYQNGLAAAVYDGSDDTMGYSATLNLGALSMFSVFKFRTVSGTASVLKFGPAGGQGSDLSCNSTNSRLQFNSGAGAQVNSSTFTLGSVDLIGCTCDGSGNVAFYRNGSAIGTGSTGAAIDATNTSVWLASFFDASGWGAYDICEFIVYSGVTSADTRERTHGYLAHRWGLAANLPSTHQFRYAAPLAMDAYAANDAGIWMPDQRILRAA